MVWEEEKLRRQCIKHRCFAYRCHMVDVVSSNAESSVSSRVARNLSGAVLGEGHKGEDYLVVMI